MNKKSIASKFYIFILILLMLYIPFYFRLPLLSRDYLLKRVDGEGLFQTYPECKDFIIEALKFHLANGQSALATSSHNPGIKEQGIAAAGGSSGNNDLTTSQFTTPRTRPRQPIGKQICL